MTKWFPAAILALFVSSAGAQDLTGYRIVFEDTFTGTFSFSNSTTYDGSRWYTKTKPCCLASSDGTFTARYDGTSGQINPFTHISGSTGLDMDLAKYTYASTLTWVGPLIASVAPDGLGFSFTYGYAESKIKFDASTNPSPSHLGIFSSFWFTPVCEFTGACGSPPGEFDLFEAFGVDPDYFQLTMHNFTKGLNEATLASSPFIVNSQDGNFHVYGLMWTAEQTTAYVDGIVIASFPTSAVMKQPYIVIVNNGLGGGWPTTATPSHNHMQVEYVRVWQKP